MTELKHILDKPLKVDNALILSLISLIDLTTLNNTDTKQDVLNLVQKANKGFNGAHPAALCTFSGFGDFVKETLDPSINVAVVGGCFPTGQALSSSKIAEVELIAKTGIDEIDVVLNRGDFFEGNFDKIAAEIEGMKSAAGTKHLKVIIETGDLETVENIKKASEIAVNAGADFIKTSTGKTKTGATPEAVFTMCNVIKTHYQKTGNTIGIKPSGGIRTLDDALIYYKIITAILGDKWTNNHLFRIGASSLYDNLIISYKNQTNF